MTARYEREGAVGTITLDDGKANALSIPMLHALHAALDEAERDGAFLLLSADVRIGVDGPFRIGLNEVRIGLTLPWFAIELARGRLTPAHADAAVVTARMYAPAAAVGAGFLDRVVPAGELAAATAEAAADLASLNAAAHTATKGRFRGGTLGALRAAIESELGPDGP